MHVALILVGDQVRAGWTHLDTAGPQAQHFF